MKRFLHSDIDALVVQATTSSRRRQHANLHQSFDDPVQRLFNAISADSYIRPHRHNHDARHETLIAIRGSFAVLSFDEKGRVTEMTTIRAGSHGDVSSIGVEVGPAEWHTVVAREDGAVLLELKAGPFNPTAAKEFADWAPEERSEEAASYLQNLRRLAFAGSDR